MQDGARASAGLSPFRGLGAEDLHGPPRHWKIEIYKQEIWLSPAYPGPSGPLHAPGPWILSKLLTTAQSRSKRKLAVVAEWYRHRIVAGFVTSSSPVPLKTRRVGQRCTLNLSRAEMSSRWCGVVVRRGGCQLRCRPRHLTMVQNYVARRQKPLCS
ncbi:uncharacterized protein TNCV_705281 [Trichonephila clavipes]|nr:uncharacterized protein TNCV_705281 [Trichonephila clavipes]